MPFARVWAYPFWLSIKRVGLAEVVTADVDWWARCIGDADILALDRYSQFSYLCGNLSEFRSLVHYRMLSAPLPLRLVLRSVYKQSPTLKFSVGRIGPGLYIEHGMGTLVGAESIGSHCWISQQVTVGYNAKGRPTLGDRVRIGPGAVVVGPITLHDGATVGPNSTVIHDVGPGETVASPVATTLVRRPSHDRDGSA